LIEADGPVLEGIARMHRGLRDGRRIGPTGPTARRSSPRRALVGACIGNVVEWYDFALYGAFATVLASVYFPGADRQANLLAAFAVFSTAFIARPAGALLFGRGGDRRGRRRVLSFAIILMSVATAGVGMLPGYVSIGLLAPVLLVLFRLAQGLSAGGEAGAASAFVVEYAPANRRGWYGGWIWATLAVGLGAGTGAASLLAWRLPQGVLETWGWRLAFLVALPIGLIGLYLRLRLDETPPFRAVQRARAVAQWPVGEALRAYPGRMLTGFVLVAAASLAFNTFFIFLPNQLAAELGVPLSRALAGALLGLAVMAAVSPPWDASPIGWAESRCWLPRRLACSCSPCRSTCSSVEAGRSATSPWGGHRAPSGCCDVCFIGMPGRGWQAGGWGRGRYVAVRRRDWGGRPGATRRRRGCAGWPSPGEAAGARGGGVFADVHVADPVQGVLESLRRLRLWVVNKQGSSRWWGGRACSAWSPRWNG
jgi:MFS family permease